jgi:hypothetical protein
MQCKTKEAIEYKITQICYSTVLCYNTFQLIIIKLQYDLIFKARILIYKACVQIEKNVYLFYVIIYKKTKKKINLIDESQ